MALKPCPISFSVSRSIHLYKSLSLLSLLLLLFLSFLPISLYAQPNTDPETLSSSTSPSSSSSLLSSLSFFPPFEDIGDDGKRRVSSDWSTNGETIVQTSFARLTPDRQSKRGALWSTKAIGARDKFSSTLKFRIHGQGKKFFGDGLALWFIQRPYNIEGKLHGIDHDFLGFGVIIDTFRNVEHGNAHRDISVVWNNGTRSLEAMTKYTPTSNNNNGGGGPFISGSSGAGDLPEEMDEMMVESSSSLNNRYGCDARVRYHNERADFTITNSSKIKVIYEDEPLPTITVHVDQKGDGKWTTPSCISMTIPALAPFKGWISQAHIGVSASTGQLADVHDVLSVHTYADTNWHPEADEVLINPKFEQGKDLPTDLRIGRIEEALSTVFNALEHIQHSHEYTEIAFQDHITNALKKLQLQESKLENRMGKVEFEIKDEIEGSMENRLKTLERTMDSQLIRKIANMEQNISDRVARKVKNANNKQQKEEKDEGGMYMTDEELEVRLQSIEAKITSAGGWRWYIYPLLLLYLVAGVGGFYGYKRLRKSHIL